MCPHRSPPPSRRDSVCVESAAPLTSVFPVSLCSIISDSLALLEPAFSTTPVLIPPPGVALADGVPRAQPEWVACIACRFPPPPASPPVVSRADAAMWLLESNPGCRVDPCALCALWHDAVAGVLRGVADHMPRSVLIRYLVHVAGAAAEAGYTGHMHRVAIDRSEEHSSDAAPPSPLLSAALAEAQAEADAHASSPPCPAIAPPSRFDASSIFPESFIPPSRGRPTDDDAWRDPEFRAVLKLLADDVVTGAVSCGSSQRSSVIFLPPGVKPRVCIDLRPVNACLRASSVRYPAARDLASARKRWHVKIDLKAAFKSVGLPHCVRDVMGFCVGGVSFVYSRLPFGWAWSPEIFTATLRTVLDPLRASMPDCAIIAYVDDIAIAHDDPVQCVRAATAIMRALRAAGFRVSVDKSFLHPVRCLRFLGMIVRGGLSPAVGVCPSLVSKCWTAFHKVRTEGCAWAGVKLWGLVSFAASSVPRLALARNALDDFASAMVRMHDSARHPDIRLGPFASCVPVMRDACVQVGLAAAEGLTPLFRSYRSRVLHLVSDASASGFCAKLWTGVRHRVVRGAFSIAECALSSAARELLALQRAVAHFRCSIRGASIVWQSDSQAGVACTDNFSSSSAACRVVVSATLAILEQCDATLTAVWSPRTHADLVEVDALSRSPHSGGLPLRFPVPAWRRALLNLPTPPTLHHDPFPGMCFAPSYAASVPSQPPTTGVPCALPHGSRGRVESSHPPVSIFEDAGPEDVIVHCVSADLKMSVGLAAACVSRFGRPPLPHPPPRVGDVIVQRTAGPTVVHLVTKLKFFHKPSHADVYTALDRAVVAIRAMTMVRCVRVPRLACGVDGLRWLDVGPVALQKLRSLPLREIRVYDAERGSQRAPLVQGTPTSECDRAPGLVWVGSHVTCDWAARAVLIAPSCSELPDVVSRFLCAAASRPTVLHVVCSRHARVSSPPLQAIDRLRVGESLLVHRGQLVSVANESAEWKSAQSEHDWYVVSYFADRSLVDGSRRLSRDELLQLMYASGFPPHPGPPKLSSFEASWTALATADSEDPWVALQEARALIAPAPPATPVVPSLRMLLEACGAPSSAHAAALMHTAGWLWEYGPTAPEVLLALEDIDRGRCVSTIERAKRTSESMLRLARDIGMDLDPYTGPALDGLACSWIRSRLRLQGCRPIPEHSRDGTPSAPAVAGDCSAMAARMRRLFLPCPARLPRSEHGLGPLASALLVAHGSSARHDASPKRVVWGWELRWGLRENREVALLHPAAVTALCLMGASMWRSCYIRRLRVCDVSRLPDGNVALRWILPHKTNRAVGDSLPSTPKLAFVSCPWVRALLDPLVGADRPDDKSPFFRDPRGQPLSYAYLTSVLRKLLLGLPRGESASLHGIRVGCDSEMKACGVPDAVRDMMGWWKLALRRMSTHYEALELSAFYAASNHYGTLLAHSLAPGIMATVGTFGDERHACWSDGFSLFAPSPDPAAPLPSRDTACAVVRQIVRNAGAVAAAGSLSAAAERNDDAAVMLAYEVWRDSGGPAAAASVRRCGYCRQPGHTRPKCPSFPGNYFAETNVVGDDASESDPEDAEEAAAVAQLAALPLPRVTCPGVGAALVRFVSRGT